MFDLRDYEDLICKEVWGLNKFDDAFMWSVKFVDETEACIRCRWFGGKDVFYRMIIKDSIEENDSGESVHSCFLCIEEEEYFHLHCWCVSHSSPLSYPYWPVVDITEAIINAIRYISIDMY